MITYKEAYKRVLRHNRDYGRETVELLQASGRVLAMDITADRDFPPFDRSTKDGIAIAFETVAGGGHRFKVEGVIQAGTPRAELSDKDNCLEIMTGAMVPKGTDTVVMYEDISITDGKAVLNKRPVPGQNIHHRGSDEKKGAVVLQKNTRISAAAIGVMAAVGITEVPVRKLPRITLISTGNELVDVGENPLPHQIRKSNMQSLYAALSEERIVPQQIHLKDDLEAIRYGLRTAMESNDVLLLSGGVSKGKYDFIPAAMEELGVQKIFHKVLQRPGKPFWFGLHEATGTLIFSFPGNPVSTFANYHIFFKDWLRKSLGLSLVKVDAILNDVVEVKGTLTLFLPVRTEWQSGKLTVSLIEQNGSGDLTSLARSDGFICLGPRDAPYGIGEVVPFVPTHNLI